MAKLKVAVTVDSKLLEEIDDMVTRKHFANRSQAVEIALSEKLERLSRGRLARESAKLDSAEEGRLADEGLADDLRHWREY